MSEMIERVAKAIRDASYIVEDVDQEMAERFARAAIEAMRDLPGDPGSRYSAGEYSRRSQEAMVDDALGV